MENRLYPMRELLGNILMQRGGGDALKNYEASMKKAPERLRGFYGAAKAAEAVGDKKVTAAYFSQLARLTRAADGDRAEVREVRQHLTSK